MTGRPGRAGPAGGAPPACFGGPVRVASPAGPVRGAHTVSFVHRKPLHLVSIVAATWYLHLQMTQSHLQLQMHRGPCSPFGTGLLSNLWLLGNRQTCIGGRPALAADLRWRQTCVGGRPALAADPRWRQTCVGGRPALAADPRWRQTYVGVARVAGVSARCFRWFRTAVPCPWRRTDDSRCRAAAHSAWQPFGVAVQVLKGHGQRCKCQRDMASGASVKGTWPAV
eukprot:gene6163-biopygen22320